MVGDSVTTALEFAFDTSSRRTQRLAVGRIPAALGEGMEQVEKVESGKYLTLKLECARQIMGKSVLLTWTVGTGGVWRCRRKTGAAGFSKALEERPLAILD